MKGCKVFFLFSLLISCSKGGDIVKEPQPEPEFIPVEALVFEFNGEIITTGCNDTLILQEEGIRELKFIGYKPSNATGPNIDSINFYHDTYTFNYSEDSILIKDDLLSSAPDNYYISPLDGDFSRFCGILRQGGESVSFYNYVNRNADFATVERDGIPVNVHWEDLGKMRRYRFEFIVRQESLGHGGAPLSERSFSLPFYERRNRVEVMAESVAEDGTPLIQISPGDTLQLHFKGLLPSEFTFFEWCKGIATERFPQLNATSVEGLWRGQIGDTLLTGDGMRYTDSMLRLSSEGELTLNNEWCKEGATASGGALCSTIPISIIVMPDGHPGIAGKVRRFIFPSGIVIETGPRPLFCSARVEILYD